MFLLEHTDSGGSPFQAVRSYDDPMVWIRPYPLVKWIYQIHRISIGRVGLKGRERLPRLGFRRGDLRRGWLWLISGDAPVVSRGEGEGDGVPRDKRNPMVTTVADTSPTYL
jgi:hypothetical protein